MSRTFEPFLFFQRSHQRLWPSVAQECTYQVTHNRSCRPNRKVKVFNLPKKEMSICAKVENVNMHTPKTLEILLPKRYGANYVSGRLSSTKRKSKHLLRKKAKTLYQVGNINETKKPLNEENALEVCISHVRVCFLFFSYNTGETHIFRNQRPSSILSAQEVYKQIDICSLGKNYNPFSLFFFPPLTFCLFKHSHSKVLLQSVVNLID